MWGTDSVESILRHDDLHDMSTRRGKFNHFLHKFRWMSCPLAVLMIPFGILALIFGLGLWNTKPLDESELFQASPPSLQLAPSNYSNLNFKNGQLEIHGDFNKPIINYPAKGSTNYYQNLDDFPGILKSLQNLNLNNTAQIHSLEIKWFKLQGPEFTAELLEIFPKIQRLKLDNVSIVGFLTPVSLPFLKDFYLNQILEDDQNAMEEYKPQNFWNISSTNRFAFLDSSYFFQGSKFKDFITSLRVSQVNITVYIDGSIVFSKDVQNHEIRLSIRTCHPILYPPPPKNIFTTITVANCADLEDNSLPLSTKKLIIYLLYRESMTTELLSKMMQRLKKLDEVYIELVEGGVEADLAAFNPNLRVLSINSMQIVVSGQNVTLPALREFYYGASNEYGWIPPTANTGELSSDLTSNFGTIFPQIRKVGLFELGNGRYAQLETVLNSTAKEITVQGFKRKNAPIDPETQDSENRIEKLLTVAGISESNEFFELVKVGPGGTVMGHELSYDEQIQRRYRMVGWWPIDVWEKYAHVRAMLDEGFFLG